MGNVMVVIFEYIIRNLKGGLQNEEFNKVSKKVLC